MFRNSLYARVLACAAGAAMLMPAMPVHAAPKSAQEARLGTDVVLVSGQFSGKLLNANGKAVEGAVVVVSKDGKEVARTVTHANGEYVVPGLSSGVHTVSMADGQFPVRLWSQQCAPTSARQTLVVSQSAVRGQLITNDGLLLTTGVIATTALIVAVIALVEAEENEDKPASP